LGSSLKRWKNIFVGDLSVNTINGLPYSGGGGAASIVYSAGGSAIVNSSIVSNMIPSITNTYSLGSTSRYWNNAYINNVRLSNRAYQEISGDISWSAVNGYYGLAKDAYPSLNPLSSGVKAVQTWTLRSSAGESFFGICWSPKLGLFVATAGSARTSNNGINWTSVTLPAQAAQVCWSQELELFVAAGAAIMSSSTGAASSWTIRSSSSSCRTVCWSPQLGLFVVVTNGASNNVITSNNGTTWAPMSVVSSEWSCICWSPELGLFVAVSASNGRVMTSKNGSIWNQTTVSYTGQWATVCWSSALGIFVSLTNDGRGMTSNNGTSWTLFNVPGSLHSVCWSPDLELFVASSTNNVSTSVNGVNWTTQSIDTASQPMLGVCWSPELGIFAFAGFGGRIMTSSLKGRPPTSYNVFDSSFNSIDETGKWTFLNVAISGTMTAGSTNVTSDDRLKHNEVGIANGLAIIDQLNPKFYQKTQTMLDTSYNGDLSGYVWTYEAGLIAQEVLQVPDLSFVVSGGDYYETVMNYELSYNILSSNDLSSNDLSNNDLSTNDLSNNDLSTNDLSYNDLSYNDLIYNDLSYTLIYYESGKYLINKIYGVNYNSLLTYGLAAIKELHAKVKAQDLSLLEQQATINSLAARLQALEQNNI
jgi:hypothetical protein